MVMKRIESSLHREALTVTGDTVGTNLGRIRAADSPVIRKVTSPVSEGGLAVLGGNLARSAVVRPTVIPESMMKHVGPAKVFEGQEEALEGLRAGDVRRGDVVVLRYEGPKGGPGLTEVFKVVGYMRALGLEEHCALVTDGKISGFARGPFICQVTPEAAEGGVLAVVEDGDLIEIDIPGRRLEVRLSDEAIQARLAKWKRPACRVSDGYLTLYARLALPADKGAGLALRLGADRDGPELSA
jgi:dihydroxy-acid dehydratase